jgi:hypothetical protein
MRRGVAHGDHVLQLGLECSGSLHLTLVIGRGVALVCVKMVRGTSGCCTILQFLVPFDRLADIHFGLLVLLVLDRPDTIAGKSVLIQG